MACGPLVLPAHTALLHMRNQDGKDLLTRNLGRPRSRIEGAREAVEAIRALQGRLNLTDEALATRVGVDQSSVSRALNREPPAWTPSLHKLWNYVETQMRSDGTGGAESSPLEMLSRAAFEAWDGTPDGLDRLVRLLAILRELRGRRTRSSTQ